MELTHTIECLKKKGFAVSVFDTKEQAADYLNANIDGKAVGFGGSVTLQQMGLYERLSAHNTVAWHWAVPQGKTAMEVLMEEQAAQIYLSSVNGMSESGEIVNIDGNCNRVSSIAFGHEKVYLVVGENKIAPDLDKAIDRARNIAAPLNAKRLNRKTPCAVKADHCYDCDSPDRICRELTVMWRASSAQPCEVVLIREALGY